MAQTDDLKPFPAPEPGQTRHVFRLPAESREEDLKVEILIGRTLRLDAENQYFFGGTITTETAEGWGFSYFKLSKAGPMAGTRMAVPPDAPKVERFIQVRGDLGLIRYNSRIPVVVYVPEGFSVKFRIWTGGAPKDATPE